jgi:hypothetical protein
MKRGKYIRTRNGEGTRAEARRRDRAQAEAG